WQFYLSKAVALCLRRRATVYRFQYYKHRCRSRPLSHLVQSLWRDSGQKELRNSSCHHGPFTRAASALEARTAHRWLRVFPVGRKTALEMEDAVIGVF